MAVEVKQHAMAPVVLAVCVTHNNEGCRTVVGAPSWVWLVGVLSVRVSSVSGRGLAVVLGGLAALPTGLDSVRGTDVLWSDG